MEVIPITQEHRDFVLKYGPNQDIGGFSNLGKEDLKKSSRLGFQYTGLFAELGWALYRYGNLDKLQKLLDFKFATLRPSGKGDEGYDDEITHNNFTRKIDIKGSHITNKDWISKLNLVIPEREYHEKMIYVCAFTIGLSAEDRLNVDEVVLAGWVSNEKVVERWRVDPKKYAVRVPDLRDLSVLRKIF
jgi:hypothetical protein